MMRATGVMDGQLSDVKMSAAPVSEEARDAATGFLIVTVLPAAFWTALFGGAANLLGYAPSTVTLATVAITIAVFLGVVFAALRGRPA
jgi:ABC-type antimicrobial peptide transport system permease subunit